MSKQWKWGKQSVELNPSKIRRDPPPRVEKTVLPNAAERETWTVVIGVLLFALAITVLTFRISDITSH